MDPTEAEDIKKRWQEYTEELDKTDLHDPDNHNGVNTHLELDILECEVKWALESITTNKASGGGGIPVELFQILKDDAVKVLHSICQDIWKTQQWPQDWKRSVFIPIPKGLLFNIILEVPADALRKEKGIKSIRIEKKLYDMIIYRENTEEFTDKPLELGKLLDKG